MIKSKKAFKKHLPEIKEHLPEIKEYPPEIQRYLTELLTEIGRLSGKDKDFYKKALELSDIYVELEDYKSDFAKKLKENIKTDLVFNHNILNKYNYYLGQFEIAKQKEESYRYFYANEVKCIKNWYKISKNAFSKNIFFRIENKDGIGILELEKRKIKCAKNKPKKPWFLKVDHISNKKYVLHFFTHKGFEKYKKSELIKCHIEKSKDQLYVRELNGLDDVDLLYVDKYQIFVYSFPWIKDLKKYKLKK